MCIQIENRQYLIPFDDTHEKGKKDKTTQQKPLQQNHFNKRKCLRKIQCSHIEILFSY